MSKELEQAIFNVLYEMRLAPRHQLEEAAKQVSQLSCLPHNAVLALTRYAPTVEVERNEHIAGMEVDNAVGKYVRLSDVEGISTINEPSVTGVHGLPRLPTPASGERIYTGHGNVEETPYYTEEQVLKVQREAYAFALKQLGITQPFTK